MDLANVRKRFLDRNMKYACSFDPRLWFTTDSMTRTPTGDRVIVVPRSAPRGHTRVGEFFHVHDETSVAGVDDRRHNCPIGTIEHIDESVVFFHDDPHVGTIEGRLLLKTNDKAAIEVSYAGTLRFRVSAAASLKLDRPLEASAWIIPVFSTTDTRYQWLCSHACVAFGTWVASKDAEASRGHNVDTNLDVYSNG
jgi:hypothetical protein